MEDRPIGFALLDEQNLHVLRKRTVCPLLVSFRRGIWIARWWFGMIQHDNSYVLVPMF